VAAVGELHALSPAVGAGLDDLRADLDVRVVEDRDNPLVHHGGQYGQAVFAHLYTLPNARRYGVMRLLSGPAIPRRPARWRHACNQTPDWPGRPPHPPVRPARPTVR